MTPRADVPAPTLSIAEASAAVAELLADANVIVAVADETRALALTRMVAALVPDAATMFCPGSDALPGDNAPASPANVGQRVSALRAIRRALEAEAPGRIALITSGEALARAYPAPAAFDAEPLPEPAFAE